MFQPFEVVEVGLWVTAMHFEGADSLYEVVCCMPWLKFVGYKCYKFRPCGVGSYALQIS